MVNRYEMARQDYDLYEMEKNSEGDFVKYEDYERLRAELAGLKGQEPVAWACKCDFDNADGRLTVCVDRLDEILDSETVPLYAASVPAVKQKRNGIYIASKTKHAERWRFLRDKLGEEIISTWIDEADDYATLDWPGLWRRCTSEASSAQVMILYREPSEELKGAWVELGAAMATGVPIFAIGIEDFNIAKDDRITHFRDMKSAISAARSLLASHASSTNPVEQGTWEDKKDMRPANCRDRLQDEGKPHPRSGCRVCKDRLFHPCPYDQHPRERNGNDIEE